MSVIEIRYEAKCKHCAYMGFEHVGKRKYRYCTKRQQRWDPRFKACDEFKLS